MRSGALEGRLGRPGEGTLLRGEVRQVLDDLGNGTQWVLSTSRIGGGTDLSLVPDGKSVKESGGNDEE